MFGPSLLLEKHNIGDVARDLQRPWLTHPVARFGDLELDVYICQGTLAMHRHIEQDELFMVYEGNMLLGSDRGDVALRPEEMVVVPKGTAHQSSSVLPATVILLRVADDLSMRRNGQWRLFSTGRDSGLEKINLGAVYMGLSIPYQPALVTRYEGWALRLIRCAGEGPPAAASPYGAVLLVMRGMLAVQPVGGEMMPARRGDVVMVPPRMAYRLVTDTAAMALAIETP